MNDFTTKPFGIRFLSMLFGLILYAVGIVVTINAHIGYAPWDVFHVGLSNTIGISIGLVSICVGMLIAGIVMLLGEKLGIGTFSNMVIIGPVIDLLFHLKIIPVAPNMYFGIPMLVAGLFIISFGSYFYIRAGFGVGPRDNLMIVISRKTKIPVGVCRSIVELLVTLGGWLLGGMVGIGTVISVLAIGFCIQITFRLFKFDVKKVQHETMFTTLKRLKRKEKV